MSRIKKTSMQDIADALGISKNSVSLALNNKHGVSEDLRAKVLETARHLNYGGLGLTEVTSPGRNILVLSPEYVLADQMFYPECIWEIERAAGTRECNVIFKAISADMESQLALPKVVHELDYLGIILMGVVNREYARKLNALGKAFVLVDTYYNDLATNAVVTNNIEGACSATKFLIDHGHSNIGFIGPIRAAASYYDRWIGYNMAMNEHGLDVPKSDCLVTSSELSCTPDEMFEFLQGLDSFPSAWFCANDRMAISLVQVLRDFDFDVPRDISVMGFDDIALSELVRPTLTTVRVKRAVICEKAVERLLALYADESDADKTRVSVYGEIIERDSVAAPRASRITRSSIRN